MANSIPQIGLGYHQLHRYHQL